VHYHQTAFLSAAAQVKTGWLATLGQVRWRAGGRPDLTEAQKHWIRLVTRRVELAQRCIAGDPVFVSEEWATDLDQDRECRRLRRRILKARAPYRPARHRHWFIVDGRLYRPFLRSNDRHYRGAWIAITGVEKGRRIRLPLIGRTLQHVQPRRGSTEGPDLRIEIGERIVLRTVEYAEVVDRPRDRIGGIDKGHDTLLTLSFGDPRHTSAFGVGVGERVSTETIAAEEALGLRRRLVAYERSLRNSDRDRAKRIRRNNLRSRRRTRSSRRVSRGFRDLVNGALNQLFREHSDLARLHVEGLDFLGRRRGHAFNRRLRRWLKGFLQSRLAYKAELNGVELNVVNAAYTSQTCPRCWFTSATNRRAQRFECGSCGFTGSADAVAATNVLRRGSDPAIARFMPSGEVKQILEERWRSALTGSAWGSNGAVLEGDVLEDSLLPEPRTTARCSPPVLGSNRATSAASSPLTTGLEPRAGPLAGEPSG